MHKFLLLLFLLSLTACDFSSEEKQLTGKNSSDQKNEITELKVNNVEKDKPKEIAGLLKKIEIDLDFDSKPDPVFLIQNNAQFSVIANIKGNDMQIFSSDYGTLQDYKNTTETYGEFSLDIINAGSVHQDENGDDKKITLNGVDIYAPPEQRHIFIFQNGKFNELSVFTP